jgi:hypothetical protein
MKSQPAPLPCAYLILPTRRGGLTLLLALLSALLFAGFAAGAVGEVTLEWDPNPEPEVSGYRLHMGTEPGSYDQFRDAGNQTTASVKELVAGKTYYFVVTAYDAAGNESLPSNEVSFTAPWPGNLLAKTVLAPIEPENAGRAPHCEPNQNPAGSDFAMQVSAPEWPAVTIFASSDLRSWTPLGTVANPTGRIVITDLESRTFSTRYYRAGRADSLPP